MPREAPVDDPEQDNSPPHGDTDEDNFRPHDDTHDPALTSGDDDDDDDDNEGMVDYYECRFFGEAAHDNHKRTLKGA
ncbi:hypothetical protein LIPSTDRAFT_28252 [Lipomyces starkeyi NRRL Y-11557]|uniref:Uncharacterized protein n=1 Tax=Lipomyces starkeyi NRRL Y-11557 TaxID=675824 RepID=A0A1E3Q4X7_LIPST|nr:hypothetical protein LIPSTDRAFT_28252 [Lipomyces starkeyi NRRL Y-11557]